MTQPQASPLPPSYHDPAETLELSVVAPAHNEEDNIAALVGEIEAAIGPRRIPYEILIVDDGSTDATRARLVNLMATRPHLRCVAMCKTPPGKGNGQSAAFHAGFRAARGRLIATLDADLQNDPADIPAMLDLLAKTGADFVQGDRSHARKDNAVRRVGSIVGRKFRLWLLGDTIRDTGCSLRVLKREIALQLPLQFKGMHRFIPVTARHLGYTVVEMKVNHRPRVAGETKYGMGITKRAIPGLIDLLAVRYMRGRRRPVDNTEITQATRTPAAGKAGPSAAVNVVTRQPAVAAEAHA
jgi:glycosyltransferase involved in cell wall biosynthesis